MTLKINILGAGKLGKTIARLIVLNKLGTIGGIYNRTLESSKAALKFIGEGVRCMELGFMSPADITLIATPDDKICECSVELSRLGNIKPGSIFVHCSGVLTSDVLSAVKVQGGLVVSIHPMRSFADPELSVANYSGTYCAIEGDSAAVRIVEHLFKSFGSIVYPIAKDKKALYHASGVFASNYLVTLAQQASSCLTEAGVDEKMALNIIINLMKGTLSNIEQLMSPKDALTGPIKRGDASTIRNHLSAFPDSTTRFLYSALGKATLELTTHDMEIKETLKTSLMSDL